MPINILNKLKPALVEEKFLKKTGLKSEEIESMIKEVEKVLSRNSYGLVWEEQEEEHVMKNKDKVLYFKEYREKAVLEGNENQPHHLLIEGDNYDALKLLQLTHKEKVDVIYIDPPYNTGKNDFIYKDNMKHSTWISFMNRRLLLAKELLTQDGLIYISIDNNEFSQLKLLCDDIFGESNFFGLITWKNRTKPKNMGEPKFKLQQNVEYILLYGKKTMKKRKRFNLEILGEKEYPFIDSNNRLYRLEEKPQRKNNGRAKRDTMIYPIEGLVLKPGYRWQVSEETFQQQLKNDNVVIQNGKLYFKVFKEEEDVNQYTPLYSNFEDVGTAEKGKEELNNIIGNKHGFETVKPLDLIKKIIFHSSEKDSIILDFFAGSGTTGQAVLELNQEDGGNRQFILCTNNEVSEKKQMVFFDKKNKDDFKNFKKNNEEKYLKAIETKEFQELGICRAVTYPRLKNIIEGYTNPEGKPIQGIPSSLHYLTIATNLTKKDLFTTENQLPEDKSRTFLPYAQLLIQLRDNVWNELKSFENDKFCLFQENDTLIFLATSELNNDNIDEIKDIYLKLKGKKGIIYTFSIDSKKSIIYSELKKIGIEAKPIPREFINGMEV